MQRVSGVWRFEVAEPDQNVRLDHYLSRVMGQLSRVQLRKVIDLGGVHLNGRRQRRCATLVKQADVLEVFLDGRDLTPYRIDAGDILYQDDYLVALNKPAGIETQPTHARYLGTLYEALGVWIKESFPNSRRSKPIGMIQRLDRDTSGLIVFTIHPRAHAPMTKAFAGRLAQKTYLAIVQGETPPEGEYVSMLARSRKNNLVKSVPAGGKNAVTRFKRLYTNGELSVVLVEPLTGRSHQIRVHFAEAGHPLLGDIKYGGVALVSGHHVARHQLHAWKLAFDHPVMTNEKVSLEAPLPEDMQEILTLMGCPLLS